MSNSKKRPPSGAGSLPDVGGVYKGAGTHIKHSIEDMAERLIATALRIADAVKATEQLVRLGTSAYLAKFGAQMAILDEQIITTNVELEEAHAERAEVKAELKHTPATLASCQANRARDDEDRFEVPFSDWQARHKAEFILLGLTMAISVIASLLTAHANLTGSGLQVFLDNPLLAWTMAALAPLSAMATKTIYEHLQSGWAVAVFKFSLIASMIVSVACWLLLYASTYHGLSPEVSVSGLFDEPSFWDSIRDTAFVAVSLSTEMLIGAVLALRMTIIAGCYSPDYSHENREFERLTKRETELEKRIRELAALLADLKGARTEFDRSLDLQIEILVFAHEGRRGAFDSPIL